MVFIALGNFRHHRVLADRTQREPARDGLPDRRGLLGISRGFASGDGAPDRQADRRPARRHRQPRSAQLDRPRRRRDASSCSSSSERISTSLRSTCRARSTPPASILPVDLDPPSVYQKRRLTAADRLCSQLEEPIADAARRFREQPARAGLQSNSKRTGSRHLRRERPGVPRRADSRTPARCQRDTR